MLNTESSLIKIDSLFTKNTTVSAGGGKIYADLISGETAAIGFDLSLDQDSFDSTLWSFMLKIANPSKDDQVIRGVDILWKGGRYFARSSTYSFVKDETDGDKKDNVFPLLIKAGTERKIRISLFMFFFVRKFFFFKKKATFLRSEIKEPDTYSEIVKKIYIKVRTQNHKIAINF